MMAYRSLKSSLTLNFIIVAVLPAVVFGIIALKILSDSMEKEITVRNELLAKSLATELNRFLLHPLTLLEQVRDVTEKNEIVTQNELNNYLNSLVGNYEFFGAIKVLDSKGIVTHLAPSDENILGLDMSNQEYYRVTLERNEPKWSQTFISPQDGKPTLTLTLPLRRGMLVGDLNLSVLNDVIDRVKIGKHGYAAITDNDGTAIAHRNRAFVSERLNVKNLTLIKAGMAGNEGSFRYHFREEEKIGSVAIVPKTRWLVAVVQTTAEAFAPINRLKNIIWVAILTAILLALFIAFGSLRKVLNPLLQITEDSKRIAEGDYTYTPATHSYTEIVNLGNSFKTMIDAVKVREEALEESEKRYRALVNESPAAILVLQDGHFTYSNPAGLRLLGFSDLKDIVGRLALDVIPPKFHELSVQQMESFAQVESNPTLEIEFLKTDGTTVAVETTSVPIQIDGKQAGLVICSDITKRKQAQEALLKSREDFRSLAGKLLSVQESERRRLAREMHDDLTHRLAVLAIDIGKMERKFQDSEDPVLETLRSIRERLVNLSGDIHAISRQLHPSILEDLELIDAIKSECSSFTRREGIAVDYHNEGVPRGIPADVAICIYRIVQEGLRNVAKHSGTMQLQISLTGKDDSIHLTIKDQGVGFDLKEVENKLGLGLVSMQERARLIQGDISIESQPGKGTVINVRASVGH